MKNDKPKAAAEPVAMPEEARELALQSVEKAQEAFDKASDMAHDNIQVFDAAANAFKASAADFNLKAMEFTQANIQAGFGFARNIIGLKDPAAIAEEQRKFMATCVEASMRQAREMTELGLAVFGTTAKPVQDGITRSFEEAKKAFVV